jgi:hypothetical protein
MTLRSLIIGIICVILCVVTVCFAELVTKYIQIGILQFPPVVIGMFTFVLIINRLAGKISKRFHLTPQEMLIIYSMMLVGTMIASRGLLEKLIPLLVSENYYANVPNKWEKLFFPHIKRWLVPWNPAGSAQQEVAKEFYEGTLSWSRWLHWMGKWEIPLLSWIILVLLVYFALLCLATLLRRQWVDNEKLSFPLIQLPLELARDEETGAFFSNRLTWIGFAIPSIIFIYNGIQKFVPSLPEIPLQYYLNQHFTTRPWSDIFYTPLYCSFAAIGFFYFLPTELLFSLWFFFAFSRLQDVIASSLGMVMDNMPLYPTHLFIGYQVAGAYIVLSLYLFFISLPHFKNVLKNAIGKKVIDDSNELLPYSVAFWGLIISFVLIVGWAYVAGLSIWLAVMEFFVYFFIVAIVMARSTAEAGMLMTETSFRPIDLYAIFASKSTLGAQNLTTLAFLDAVFTRDQRGLLLTAFLDGLKLGDGVGIKRRQFLPVFATAILVALGVGIVLHLMIPYKYGGITLYEYVYQGNCLWAFQDHAPAIESHISHDWRAPTFFAVGAVFTFFLAFMRFRYYWWPLHPLGYALCASWTMIVFWFPVFVAWIIKWFITRYGGMKLFAKGRPLFLGMILGEFTMAVVWTLISSLTRVPPPFFPWP